MTVKIKINLNIFLFIVLFAITKQIEIYALVMIFALIHELGHLTCGLLLGFQPSNLRILPLGFAVEFRIKIDDYNHKIGKSNILTVKKILINLAGPITNLLMIALGSLWHWNVNTIYANWIVFFVNMMPIYPLDGGRVINNMLKILVGNLNASILTNKISNGLVIIITIISSIAIYYYKNIAILFAVMFLWSLIIYENKKFNTYYKIYKTIDKEEIYG